jgi:hypothetical protein
MSLYAVVVVVVYMTMAFQSHSKLSHLFQQDRIVYSYLLFLVKIKPLVYHQYLHHAELLLQDMAVEVCMSTCNLSVTPCMRLWKFLNSEI